MWEPQRLTTLWAFMACYRDSFTFYLTTPRLATNFNKFNWNRYEVLDAYLQPAWRGRSYLLIGSRRSKASFFVFLEMFCCFNNPKSKNVVDCLSHWSTYVSKQSCTSHVLRVRHGRRSEFGGCEYGEFVAEAADCSTVLTTHTRRSVFVFLYATSALNERKEGFSNMTHLHRVCGCICV
jgi:hypothetical protein